MGHSWHAFLKQSLLQEGRPCREVEEAQEQSAAGEVLEARVAEAEAKAESDRGAGPELSGPALRQLAMAHRVSVMRLDFARTMQKKSKD